MCVIAYKAKNVRFPSKERIEDMWYANPDGAGIMWRDNDTNKIKFIKGFMSLDKFNKWIEKNRKWLEDVECALHFRITTHGGTSKGNCHPFVCDCNTDSHLLKGEADYVLMHNGVLPIKPRKANISDSAELALRVGMYENPMDCLDVFDELLHGNRVICMGKECTMMYGDAFVDCCKDGIMYSNDHFVDKRHEFEGFGIYDEDWWDNDYSLLRPAKPKNIVSEGAMVKTGDVVGKKDGTKNDASKNKNNGWWWDSARGKWWDMFGNEATIEEIDPDSLSTDDYDEYLAQLEEGRFNGRTVDQLQEEADYYGMDLDEYIEWINGGE